MVSAGFSRGRWGDACLLLLTSATGVKTSREEEQMLEDGNPSNDQA